MPVCFWQADRQHSRLQVAVRGGYFLQFLLTLVLGFILLKMDEALGRSGSSRQLGQAQPIGFETSGLAVSSQETNQIRVLRSELEQLRSELQNPSINTPINTGINTPSEVERLIFDEPGESDLTSGIDPDEVAFLRKYKRVVRALLDGKSYGKIIGEAEVSKSTVQNVKRSMKAVRLL